MLTPDPNLADSPPPPAPEADVPSLVKDSAAGVVLEEPPAAPPELTPYLVRELFAGKNVANRAALPGRMGAALITCLAWLVPTLFFALVGALAYALVILCVYTKPEMGDGLHLVKSFFAWAAPILAGGILLYYMIKPLFLRPVELTASGRYVTPEEQPLLYEFVDQVARCIGAPLPARIYVDCGTEVKIRLPVGQKNTSTLEELELVLGLSYLASATARQLAAVVGAELGRYQKRSCALEEARVRRVARWMARITEYQDPFDKSVEDFCESESKIVRSFGLFLRWVIRFVRGILGGLLAIALVLARRLTFPLQHAADAAAARLVGRLEFCTAVRLTCVLPTCRRLAERNLGRVVRDGLPENFPGFVAATEARLPKNVRETFIDAAERGREIDRRLSPSLAARIQAVGDISRHGVLEIERPASDLVTGYDDLCSDLSAGLYSELYGPAARSAWIQPNSRFISEQEDRVFSTSGDAEMVDYHAGDRWHKWRVRLTALGSFIMTVALLVHTGGKLAEVSITDEQRYRRNIGKSVLVEDSTVREILDVKYFEAGEPVGLRDPGEGEELEEITAPSPGWYYDTGQGYVVPCDELDEGGNFYDSIRLEDAEETPVEGESGDSNSHGSSGEE